MALGMSVALEPSYLRRARWLLLLSYSAIATGCGGGAEPDVPSVPGAPSAVALAVPVGSLSRQQVVEAVDAGLGAFLQRVQVEPVLSGERFLGYKILSIQPSDSWAEFGLKEGDVVTQVNARTLENENQAFETFQSLRSAEAIRVQVLRDGQAHHAVIPIMGSPAPAGSAPPSGKPAPPTSTGS